MENQILDRILITTYTMQSLKKRLKALKSRLSEHFFGGDTNKQMVLDELEWLNSAGVGFVNDFNKETFYQSFTKLEKLVGTIKPLTMYTAFVPDEEGIKLIGGKLRTLYSDKLVIDLKYDPELIGGCAFIWNGVYKDYSIRSRIGTDKNKILNSFKSYLAAKK